MSNIIEITEQGNIIQTLSILKNEKVQNLPKGLNVEFRGENGKLTINKNTKFVNTSIRIGNNSNVHIGETRYSIVSLGIWATFNSTSVIIGKDFSCWGCEMKLEEQHTSITIGDDCMFSYGISIRPTDGHAIYDLESKKCINIGENIILGNHVWVGYAVTILKGVNIADNSIIGARSLVSKKFLLPNVVIGGVPAVILRKNVNWLRKGPTSYQDEQSRVCTQ